MAQRVNVVGIYGHYIARLVGVEKAYGQRLHLVEHRLTRIRQKRLRDYRHQTGVQERAEHGYGEDNAYYSDKSEQFGKVRLSARVHGLNYIVHLTYHVIGHQNVARGTRHAQHNAQHDEYHMHLIVFEQCFEQHADCGRSAMSYLIHRRVPPCRLFWSGEFPPLLCRPPALRISRGRANFAA